MGHVHKEPREWFWGDFMMSIFAPFIIIIFISPLLIIFFLYAADIFDRQYLAKHADPSNVGNYFLAACGFITFFLLIMCIIRTALITRIDSLSFDETLLKAYDDGCFGVRRMFWRKGGTVYEVPLSPGEFGKGEGELTKHIASQLAYKEDHVNVLVPVAIKIQMFPFDPKEYYEKIVAPGKKTFEGLAKETFESSLDAEAIREVLSSYANEAIIKKELLKQLSKIVTFDEKLFSNIIGAKITFGDPVFQACAGTLCSVPAK